MQNLQKLTTLHELFFLEQSEFLYCILATVAKVARAMGGFVLAAVVIDTFTGQ